MTWCLQVPLECRDQHQELLVDVLEGRLPRLLQQAGLLPAGVGHTPPRLPLPPSLAPAPNLMHFPCV